MITTVRRLLAVALAGVAVAAAPAAAQSPLPAPATPALAWGPCGRAAPAPFECATAAVPLDYDQPAGATIPLAVVRRPAAAPAERLGTLFINPGGPGGSGVDAAVDLAPLLPAALRDRFDVVGFDPRGVARSSEVACWTRREYDAAFAATQVVTGVPSLAQSLRTARGFVEACRLRSGALLPYVGTEFVARDMDLLRAAVGDERLTYLGLSYGTYIGTVYANLFPDRVRALVLDGAYDPAAYRDRPYDYDEGQYVALGALPLALPALVLGAPPALRVRRRARVRGLRRADGAPRRRPAAGAGRHRRRGHGGDAGGADAGRGPGGVAHPGHVPGGRGPHRRPAAVRADLRIARRPLQPQHRRGVRRPRLPPQPDAAAAAAARRVGARAATRAPVRLRPAELRPRPRHRLHAVAAGGGRGLAQPLSGGFAAAGAPPVVVVGTTGDPDTPYPDAVALARTLAEREAR